MKKTLLVLTILLTASFANAQSQTWYQSIFDRITSFINEARKDNLPNEARLQQYENAKQLIQTEIDRLKNTVSNTVSVSSQTINASVDFSDKRGAVLKFTPTTAYVSASEYYSYPQISGKAPLTVKFVNNFSSLSYGDGTNSQELHEGTYDNQMGYSLYGQTTTHTYTKPGRYVVEAFGNMPSGKRAEVEVIVSDNAQVINTATPVNTNSNCQRITQTLWEGNTYQNQNDVKSLQQYLSFKGHGYNLKDDGIYSSVVTNAVKHFQASYGIKQTGSVGPVTLAKINSMICGNSATQPVANNRNELMYFTAPYGEVVDTGINPNLNIKWYVQDFVNPGFDFSKFYVTLSLVDENGNTVMKDKGDTTKVSIGDGFNLYKKSYTVNLFDLRKMFSYNNGTDRIEIYGNVKLKAEFTYQPTMIGCDPNVKGECAPLYSEQDKKLIEIAKKYQPVYSKVFKIQHSV